MKKPKFYGSTTVGERGQIVLPVQIRKDFHIKKGDKLLVMGHPNGEHITLFNQDTMNKYLEIMSKNINQIKSKIKEQ